MERILILCLVFNPCKCYNWSGFLTKKSCIDQGKTVSSTMYSEVYIWRAATGGKQPAETWRQHHSWSLATISLGRRSSADAMMSVSMVTPLHSSVVIYQSRPVTEKVCGDRSEIADCLRSWPFHLFSQTRCFWFQRNLLCAVLDACCSHEVSGFIRPILGEIPC